MLYGVVEGWWRGDGGLVNDEIERSQMDMHGSEIETKFEGMVEIQNDAKSKI